MNFWRDATIVVHEGIPELQQAVDDGLELALAADIARMHAPDRQRLALADGLDGARKAAREFRAALTDANAGFHANMKAMEANNQKWARAMTQLSKAIAKIPFSTFQQAPQMQRSRVAQLRSQAVKLKHRCKELEALLPSEPKARRRTP